MKVKKKQQQPFRSNSIAFIIASRTVYARIRCYQTTAASALVSSVIGLTLILSIMETISFNSESSMKGSI